MVNIWMNDWMNEWMELEQMVNIWMSEWMNEWMDGVRAVYILTDLLTVCVCVCVCVCACVYCLWLVSSSLHVHLSMVLNQKDRGEEEKTAQPEYVLTLQNLKHGMIMLQQIFSLCSYVEQCINISVKGRASAPSWCVLTRLAECQG